MTFLWAKQSAAQDGLNGRLSSSFCFFSYWFKKQIKKTRVDKFTTLLKKSCGPIIKMSIYGSVVNSSVYIALVLTKHLINIKRKKMSILALNYDFYCHNRSTLKFQNFESKNIITLMRSVISTLWQQHREKPDQNSAHIVSPVFKVDKNSPLGLVRQQMPPYQACGIRTPLKKERALIRPWMASNSSVEPKERAWRIWARELSMNSKVPNKRGAQIFV